MLEEAADDEEEAIEYYDDLLKYLKDNDCDAALIEKIECIKAQEEEHLKTLEEILGE